MASSASLKTAALPWAHGHAPSAGNGEAALVTIRLSEIDDKAKSDAGDDSVPLQELGLELGDEIEVMWRVPEADGEFSTFKWRRAIIAPMDPDAPVRYMDGSSSDEDEDQGAAEGAEEDGAEEGAEGKGGAEESSEGKDRAEHGAEGNAGGKATAGNKAIETGRVEPSVEAGSGATAAEGTTDGPGKEAGASGQAPASEGEAAGGDGDDDAEEEEEDALPQHIYCLKYVEADGFEQQDLNVIFRTKRWLIDLGSDQEMGFRKLGDTWAPQEELFAEMSNDEIQRGLETMSSAALQAATHLDPVAQRVVASGMREFMDALMAGVKNARDSMQDDAVLTRDHIEAIVEQVTEQQEAKKRRRFR